MQSKLLLLFFRLLKSYSFLDYAVISREECLFFFEQMTVFIRKNDGRKAFFSTDEICIGYLGDSISEKEKGALLFFIQSVQKTIKTYRVLFFMSSEKKASLEGALDIKIFFYDVDEEDLLSQFNVYKKAKDEKLKNINKNIIKRDRTITTPISIDHYFPFYLYLRTKLDSNSSLKVLEIGAYIGVFIDFLATQNINIDGVEKDSKNKEYSLSSRIRFEDFLDGEYKRYDCILAVNFFHQDLVKDADLGINEMELCDVIPVINKCLFLLNEGGEMLFNCDDTKEGRAVLELIKNEYSSIFQVRGGVFILRKD